MPKQFYKLNDFSGGLNWNRDARDINDNECLQADYCDFGRVGSVKYSGYIDPATGISPNLPTGLSTMGGGYFYYETDRKSGSSASTNGEKWFALLDSLTCELNVQAFSDASQLSNVVDLGAITSGSYTSGQLTYSSATLEFTRSAGSTFTSLGIEEGDVIRITGATTNTGWNKYVIVQRASDTKIRLFNGVSGTSAESGTVTIAKIAYGNFFAEGDDLRISDASLGTATSRKKYHYVNRTHFEDAGTAKDTYDNWFDNDCDLTPPTELQINSGYPAAGAGFRLSVDTPTGGSFAAKTYQIAGSFVYEDGQESLLYIPTSAHQITTAANDKINVDVRATPAFNERLTGARIYIREDGSNEPWSLLCDISLKDGNRAKFDSEFSPWVRGASDSEVYVDNVELLSENFETYTIINGFGPDEFAIDLGGTGENYKCSTITNRRCFIANIKMTDPEDSSNVIHMRDRIMFSPIGKFDTFPRTFFIDVIRGDAEGYTALSKYGDRLFAFKNSTLYIVNVASPSPSNWFLESTERRLGVQYQGAVYESRKGIFWVNTYGVFWFDGDKIRNLTEGSISAITYSTYNFEAGMLPTIVYYERTKSLYVKINTGFGGTFNDTSDSGGWWVYNTDSGAWSRIRYNGSGASNDFENFYSNPIVGLSSGSELLFLGKSSTDSSTTTSTRGDITESLINYSNDSVPVIDNQIFITKDLDFGAPGQVKKIYSVVVTYRSSIAQTDPVAYSIDGGTSYTSFTGNFTETGTGTDADGWSQMQGTLTSPVECQSVKIRIRNETSGGFFEINDIAIEYRPIYKRVS